MNNMPSAECPTCTGSYEKLGQHWAMSDCEFPQPTPHQYEISTGVLMGDGSLYRRNPNPFFQVTMVTEEYLEHLDSQFPVLGIGVSCIEVAESKAKKMRERGYEGASAENYSDVYRWTTRTNPHFERFEGWYSSGEKVWPEGIDLTPTVLKHWYCGDGHFANSGTARYMKIIMNNEIDNKEKVERYFKEGPGVEVSNWSDFTYDSGRRQCSAEFNVAESETLFKYMGDPLPGFEYKWP